MNSLRIEWRSILLVPLVLVACGDGDEEDPDEHVADEHVDEISVVLDSAGLAMADLAFGTADSVSFSLLNVTATITYDQNRVSHVGPRTEGRIRALRVDLGEAVRTGQVLAVIESPLVGATRAEMHEARALVEIAHENYERERRLEEQGVSSRRELLDAEADLRRAEAALQRSAEQLRALGAADGEGSEFVVGAPFTGTVVEKHATVGEVVGQADQLFTVADLDTLWVELDIYERDLGAIETGQPVTVTTAAYPDRTFDGRIVYLGDILDSSTRTVRARVEVANSDGVLKPGMFARARIELPSGSGRLMVPRDAVQTVEGEEIVWRRGEEAGEFHAARVETGETTADGRVEILSGISGGDTIVTEGAFTLKAQLSKGEFGGHGH